MTKIHTLKISHFRWIESFEQVFWLQNFICLVWRWDSGKSTILDAICCVLSASWNLWLSDIDFHNHDISQPIKIAATLYELPPTLMREEKYWLHQRFLDIETNTVSDIATDNTIPALTIELTVEKDLEARRYVINDRQDPKEIKTSDRATLNVFLISDYINQHFSWWKWSPLSALLKQEWWEHSNDEVIDILREAHAKVWFEAFNYLEPIVSKIKSWASQFGVNISQTSTTIDFKDIVTKDNKVTLHDNKIPFRLKWKGSKRLISMAIQNELVQNWGIVLIDEVEQGLEPDRVKHVIRNLMWKNQWQIILTTHAQWVVEDVECENLLRIKNEWWIVTGQFVPSTDKFQMLIRRCPEAIYAKKVIVCEGKTELGICRAMDEYRIQNRLPSMSSKDTVYIRWSWNESTETAKRIKEMWLKIALFCDSDVDATLRPSKQTLRDNDISIFDCDDGFCIEKHIINELPWAGIKELIQYRISKQGWNVQSVFNDVNNYYEWDLPTDWVDRDTQEIRNALFAAATYKTATEDKSWFKRIDHWIFLGSTIYKYFPQMDDKPIKAKIIALSTRIDND